MIKYFSWQEFDNSVELIACKTKNIKFSGIFGIPRGGLCLAVALSHRLNLKIFQEPKENTLIVDDIYESGLTLNKYKGLSGSKYFVLFSKVQPIWWEATRLIDKKAWVVFPWESEVNILSDKNEYRKKRGLN